MKKTKNYLISILTSFLRWNKDMSRFLERRFPKFFGYPRNYHDDLLQSINKWILEKDNLNILEVGGTDRPLLPKSQNYKYVGIDIEEKSTCYEYYDEFIVQSVEAPITKQFDLIISLTLLEHVKDNSASFKSMYGALKANGAMMHYIPSKFHFYSICLRIVGPRIQKLLIKYLRPEVIDVTGYPAFFDKCSPSGIERLCKKVGFSNVVIVPYYKATDYFDFFVPAFVIVSIFENLFEFLGVRFFASGMIVFAYKKV